MDASAAASMSKAVEHDGGVDEVAVELPLEVRLNGEPVAVTIVAVVATTTRAVRS